MVLDAREMGRERKIRKSAQFSAENSTETLASQQSIGNYANKILRLLLYAAVLLKSYAFVITTTRKLKY